MEVDVAAGGAILTWPLPGGPRRGAPRHDARLRRHWLGERLTAAGLIGGPLPLVGPPLTGRDHEAS